MIAKIKKFAIYIAMGLFALGYVILRAGLKNDNAVFLFIGIISMLIVAILIGIYFLASGFKQRKQEREYQKQLQLFKLSARKIVVSLEDVEIKSNNWTDKILKDDFNYGLLDAMAGYDESNFMQVDRNLNAVAITLTIDGSTIDYFVNIEMEPKALAMHFAIKKETYLYISAEERYLDLEFLN